MLSLMITVAIGLAAFAALCLALGTHLQHRALSGASVAPSAPGAPPPPRRLLGLLRSPPWLLGLSLLTLETVLNIVALGLAPVALIQPIGTLSLVAAVVLGSRAAPHQGALSLRVLGGIGLTLLSTSVFVGVSAQWSTAPEAAAPELLTLTFLLLGIAGLGAAIALSTVGHGARVVTAGVLFGLVATGAHALLHAFTGRGAGAGTWMSSVAPVHVILLVGLAVGSVVGVWIVQTAYASGPPETVLAGLTVIDPLTAVLVGAVVLGEYTAMPPFTVLLLLVAGASAVAGVFLLVRVHPSVVRATPSMESPTDEPPAPPPAPDGSAAEAPAESSAGSPARSAEPVAVTHGARTPDRRE